MAAVRDTGPVTGRPAKCPAGTASGNKRVLRWGQQGSWGVQDQAHGLQLSDLSTRQSSWLFSGQDQL